MRTKYPVLYCVSSHNVLKCSDLMCQQPPLACVFPQRNNKVAWLRHGPLSEQALGLDCFGSVLMHEACKGQESHIIVGIPQDTVRGENTASFPITNIAPGRLSCSSLLAFSQTVTSPFCKTTIINQNPISQHRQVILEWQMFRGHLQQAFQLFYSLPPPLSHILSRCCRHEIDTPGSICCANSPPAATADFTNDGEMARRAEE